MLNGFQRRARTPELMDLPNADPGRLLRTVRQFKWTNLLFSRSRSILKRHVLDGRTSGFSILDVGAGGGDIMRWLVDESRRRRLPVRVVCLDTDEAIADFARSRCASYPEITVQTGDVHLLPSSERFDYVFCNNFLHHFPDDAVPSVLRKMHQLAVHGLIVNDIHRSQAAYWGYGIFAGLFLHRSFARYDGLLSIRKGFRSKELRALVSEAELESESSIEIREIQPARLVLTAKSREGGAQPPLPTSKEKGVSQ